MSEGTEAEEQPDLTAEHRDAAALATAAGRALLELREGPPRFTDLGAAGDRLAHQLLVKELNRLYPDDDVRSEEGLEHVSGTGRLWIIDPLDGTREFASGAGPTGPSTWRWSSAAWPWSAPWRCRRSTSRCRRRPRRAGAVRAAAPPRVVVSRSRPPDVAYDVAEAIGGVMVPMGSAGAKIGAVILGRPTSTSTPGGSTSGTRRRRWRWRRRAACTPRRLNGDPLRYGAPDAWLPDLMVCRPRAGRGRAGGHHGLPALRTGRRGRRRPETRQGPRSRRARALQIWMLLRERGLSDRRHRPTRWRVRSRPAAPWGLGWSRTRPFVLLRGCGTPYRRSRSKCTNTSGPPPS